MDMIEVDLSPVFQSILNGSFRSLLNGVEGCVPEVGISAEALSAALTEYLGFVGCVVGPDELRTALLAVKCDGNGK
jgi:hypothetical protein